jgi:hypothetical protein
MPANARLLFLFGLIALAACGGGSSSSGSNTLPISPIATPTVAPAPSAAPSTPAAPAAISTSVPLSINTAGGAPAISAPIPAPSGYTSNLSVGNASAATGTTVAVNSSVALPTSTSIPVLSTTRNAAAVRTIKSVRIPQSGTAGATAIFFDSFVPSSAITVAGSVSASQVFPTGVLTSGTQYSLAFLNGALPSPAWQTIAGPVTTTDGVTLTFSGTIGSLTLQAGQLYAFAIFAPSTVASPPPAAPQTLAYLNTGTSIQEVNAAGVTATALPIAVNDEALLDDSGNIYAMSLAPAPAPVASGAPTPAPVPPTISMYPAGTSTIGKSYTPSNPLGLSISTSGSGAFAAIGPTTETNGVDTFINGQSSETIDVWNAGASGPPSRTINTPAGAFGGFMAHDGTLFVPLLINGMIQYDVYAPGSSTVTRTISETIVPAAQQANFTPNFAAVGPDGTLYVTEYAFFLPDPLAGLYIYSPNGTEKFVATTSNANGAGPQGVDLDASGNIYVVNNNSGIVIGNGANGTTETNQNDSLHDIEVFAPGGTSALRHITGSFTGQPLSVAADGTVFFSSFDILGINPGGATFAVAAGSTTPTQITAFPAAPIPLYEGNLETSGSLSHRRTANISNTSIASSGHGSFARLTDKLASARHRLSVMRHR